MYKVKRVDSTDEVDTGGDMVWRWEHRDAI
jgi:hypothetical protein